MRTILRKLSDVFFPSIEGGVRGGSLLLLLILLAPFTASAQKVIVQDLESWMSSLITQAIDNKVVVDKNLGQERDIQKEGNPLKWRCDILTFTLSKKQRSMLEDMIRAFEENGHHNPNCYGINSKRTGTSQTEGKRNLMIGDNPNNYVTIGENYGNYLNVNILDATDTTKTHRYAYALEWKEDRKGNAFVRYIVTYAKIPSAFTSYNATIKYPSLPDGISNFIKERSRNPKGTPQQAPDKAQAWFMGQDSIIIKYNELKPYMLYEKWVPRDSVALYNQLSNDGSFLLNFYNLRKWYQEHQNAELTAISIYELCKLGVKYDAFKSPNSTEVLEQVSADLCKLIDEAKTETDRKYFKMALDQLNQIKKKRK